MTGKSALMMGIVSRFRLVRRLDDLNEDELIFIGSATISIHLAERRPDIPFPSQSMMPFS